ncbi:acyltransferase [Sphingomonas sp. RB56-2]|uniref:Acyltransferase n=1 Tax=Sphingomonas brevis TaxID=2908206 RepID=A0ABT0S5N8_9SPHN|nr:acyltransferase [Sphingomonas brevis]
MAILVVMLFHSNPDVLVGGYVGVDLFFVLSGYLITSILVEEYRSTGAIDVPRFYLRRFLRLAPALLFMLAGYLLVAPIVWPGEPHFRDALYTAFYVTDFTLPAGMGPDHLVHSWSLSVEEQFYLLWPLALVPLMRSGKAVPFILLALLVMIAWRGQFTDWKDHYYRIDTHSSGLLVGALLHFIGWKTNRWVGLAGLAILLFVSLYAQREWNSPAILATEIAAVMLIASVRESRWLEAPLLVHIGKLSYGLYLWHYPIAHYLRSRFDFFETVTMTLLLSYLMALLSYHSVEAWSRRMKDRISAPRQREPVLTS